MARDPIKLTIQGDDDDGLRFERWLAEILTLCGGDSHPEFVRLMMERIERREEIRARNLGVRVTRNNVTEPTPGTIAHRVWDIISRLRKPDGSVDRHDVLNAAVKEGINLGTVTAQWSRWNRFHGMKRWHEERGSGVKWADLPVPRRMAKGVPEKSLRPWRLASLPLASFALPGVGVKLCHHALSSHGERCSRKKPPTLAAGFAPPRLFRASGCWG